MTRNMSSIFEKGIDLDLKTKFLSNYSLHFSQWGLERKDCAPRGDSYQKTNVFTSRILSILFHIFQGMLLYCLFSICESIFLRSPRLDLVPQKVNQANTIHLKTGIKTKNY